mgnify:CR=1 FL=1
MGLLSILSKFKFYVIDRRSKPEEIFEFDSRGQAVNFSYKRSSTSRHHPRLDNVYVIPESKGKAKHR